MFCKHYLPLPQLKPYIDCFWIINSKSKPGLIRSARIPADYRAMLLFNFQGTPRLITSKGKMYTLGLNGNLLGAHSKSMLLEHEGDTFIVAIQFLPGGLAPFIPYPINEFTEQIVQLPYIWGKMGKVIYEKLYEEKDFDGKISLLQEELSQYLCRTIQINRFSSINHLISQIQASYYSGFTVEQLSRQINFSQRQLERVFYQIVGLSPKLFMRLDRFQKVIRYLAQGNNSIKLTEMAQNFNYYDHSHMIKDFQSFVGSKPSEFYDTTEGIIEVAYGNEII